VRASKELHKGTY